MNKIETAAIESIAKAIDSYRDELHGYHVEVKQLITRCECCRDEVKQLSVEMYGPPGKKEKHPGVLGMVHELWRTRRRMVRAMGAAWTLLAGLCTAAAAAYFRKN
jgi:hypothetical protein